MVATVERAPQEREQHPADRWSMVAAYRPGGIAASGPAPSVLHAALALAMSGRVSADLMLTSVALAASAGRLLVVEVGVDKPDRAGAHDAAARRRTQRRTTHLGRIYGQIGLRIWR